MHEQEALDRLAELCGIASDYTDVWGQTHSISAATKRALLTAMGLAIADPAQLHAALADCELGPWRRLLPPVWVHRLGPQPLQIPITLAAEPQGIALHWRLQTEGGSEHRGELRTETLAVLAEREVDGKHCRRYAFAPDLTPQPGYHRLHLTRADELDRAEMALISAPATCYRPPALDAENRWWGLAVQLYAVHSHRNAGIGDFTDLRHMIELCHTVGADFVGVNPLHSLFPHNPAHASPYSPSSRLFHNVLYLDIEVIPELDECAAARELIAAPEYQAQLAALQNAPLVDYPAIWALKVAVLERLYADFRRRHLLHESTRGQAFRSFQAAGGETLEHFARYQALQAHFQQQDTAIWGWPAWPAAYRDPNAPAVAEFALDQRERVEFFQYLQWQADRQLAAVSRRADELGLGVGLYQDLAVSVDRAGADVWSEQALYATDVSIGAPPDDFNLKGQDWGLPPLVPERLREQAYASFIALLRQNMRHAGALRIDHVMALMRLFWVPPGATSAEGAYVHYPVDDLLGILALESQRNRCLVIGEDLGTLPETLRDTLGPLGVLSYRILYFERDDNGEFKRPEHYPEQALAAITTHDLPTLAGFWLGHDLALRQHFNLFPTEQHREEQIVGRAQDRARLLLALQRENLLPEGLDVDPVLLPEMTDPLIRAIHRFMARTPARLMAVQPEDVFDCVEQVNLPGTVDAHPNWRRRLPVPLEAWSQDTRFVALCAALRGERPSAPQSAAALGKDAASAVPTATYRLQFNRDFTFAQATQLVAYLHDLGISHCYASPYLKARSGSAHGYDIIDHTALNPELGDDQDFERFVGALHGHGMGQILDIVPNHMGVMGSDNRWWLDVLENGRASPYAEYFDIDWRPVKEELRGKVLLPVLGAPYGDALEAGDLRLQLLVEQGELSISYHEHRFPIDPTAYPDVLGLHLERLAQRLGDDQASLTELQSIITAFGHLPSRETTDAAAREERLREKEVCKRRLAWLCQHAPAVGEFLAGNVAFFCGRSGEPESFAPLHGLLERQAYRLAHWQVAADEINYRRFFDVNDLAALRMENSEVFEATHQRIFEWIENGQVNGLRIDHPDGLYDPLCYCQALAQRLQTKAIPLLGETDQRTLQPYLVVEKILAGYEHLPEHWPVAGTTGYDFAQTVNALFVYAPAEQAFERIYQRFIGKRLEFDELLYDCKKLIIRVHLSSELTVLANRLDRIAQANWRTRDYTLNGLRDALTEIVACFPVYRTYVSETGVSNEDRRYVDWAIAQAKKRSPATGAEVFDFIRALMLLEGESSWPTALRQQALQFTLKLQQYTAPVMAKGLEDTAFYIYNRLISLNEVGGDPRRFGVSVAAFHHFNQEHGRRWPHALLATSTHDNKRSEDVRARINVLTELPAAWRGRLARWRRMNRTKRRTIDTAPAPSRNDQYLFYQTLAGAWPLDLRTDAELEVFRERIEAFLLKAIREAKMHSSWLNPNPAYEEAAVHFVRAVLSSLQDNPFLSDLRTFIKPITRYGLLNSLAQTLLKLTSPGVPDIYQGNELWDFSLVDPDNRRSVDYAYRERLLGEVRTITIGAADTLERLASLLENLEDGRLKLYLTRQTLLLRQRHRALFQHGDYQALDTQGQRAAHICAFARGHAEEVAVVATGRWFARLAAASEGLASGESPWADTWVEAPTGGRYLNALTGEYIAADEAESGACFAATELFRCLPVALLLRQEG
ncbi:malto-oligosyltrehalose synthase [Nitrococcus mobilis]|uniref:4-alpha-glucanotransferase n=1 Tax=Nitrococcus mobilis Nb-231 TaxID=314278 RepID=A4BM92_9GAMM|nr:malto-oligosyltrehalose synthase [Nitrococcus mobilis]EAR23430.1 Alpha amylase, catalytic subdomain [Nitrococcus mobilis Nb-231]